MPQPSSALPLELRLRRGLVAGAGALFGVSVFVSGFYASSVWGPLSLGALALCLALVLSGRRRPSWLALGAIGALGTMWLWSLASRAWSASPQTALVDANRWALYAAILAVLGLLLRDDRGCGRLLLGSCTAVILAVGLYVLARMASGHAGALFLGTRLNGPLGYVNGQANYLLLGFWPLLAVAENVRRPLRAAAALGAATTLASLLYVGQSRGSLLALIASALVVLAVLPGRRARILALVVTVACLYAVSGTLANVNLHPDLRGVATASALEDAALGAFAAGGGAAVLWAAIGFGAHLLAPRRWRGHSAVASISTAALVALAVAGGVIAVARAGSVRHTVRDQYQAFVNLGASPGPSQTRLLSGGGDRYDYWRIAWLEFRRQPLRGVGAGGYDVGYYRLRHTTEAIRQPHSIELQSLAELGVVGGLALLAFVLTVLAGLIRAGRDARADPRARIIAVAAGGTFVAWLAHASVDWIQLLPGVSAVALSAAAVLLAPRRAAGAKAPANAPQKARATPKTPVKATPKLSPVWPRLGRAAGVVPIVVATLFTARVTLAQHAEAQASRLLARDPVTALRRTGDALALEPNDVSAYYTRAAALARLGTYVDARAALEQALSKERDNWVTWALLGDLATRRGDRLQARRDYQTALALNPRESGLGATPTVPSTGGQSPTAAG